MLKLKYKQPVRISQQRTFHTQTFKKGGQYQNVIIGEHDESIKITVGDKEIPVSIAWGYNGTTWAELGTTSTVAYCPEFKNPTIIYYNNLLYTFGDKFESIYVSKSEGIAWQKSGQKSSHSLIRIGVTPSSNQQ